VFELPPEAATEEAPGATIFLRVPQSLKTRIEMAANQSGTSINTYGLRCLERCLGTGD
jgi:predicted HicB family RNase H-like nuclease